MKAASTSIQTDILLSTSDVLQRLGVSETTLWRMEKRNEFPKPLMLSKRCKRWRAADVDAFIAGASGAD